MSSLSAIRNSARNAFVNAAVRMAPRAGAAPLRVAPALWSRSFASGGFLPKDEVSSRVLDVVKNFQNVDPAKVTSTSHFINDLGLDSLDTVEVCPACGVSRSYSPAQTDAAAVAFCWGAAVHAKMHALWIVCNRGILLRAFNARCLSFLSRLT